MFPKRVFDPIIYIDNLTIQPFTSNGAHNKHKKKQGIIKASRKIKAILFRLFKSPQPVFAHFGTSGFVASSPENNGVVGSSS